MDEQPRDTAQVGDGGRDHPDAGVGVLDPVDGDLVNPQPGSLSEHEQLGVEKPFLVLDLREQCRRHVATYRLETTLGVAEAGSESETQAGGCTCER